MKSGESKVILGRVPLPIVKKFQLEDLDDEIIMWKDRLEYIEKHREEYSSHEDYLLNIRSIPDIVNNPDYVGINPDGSGIEFVKKINSFSMVAVRISNSGQLIFRSLYPISESKLKNRMNSGRWVSVEDIYDEYDSKKSIDEEVF
ncbi:PBECR2 nuclease fold domain-containing protein [Fusibacter sp. 3D3]|uniref:PBECR3 domain-containing polyvalent protein n=1 Tax=Fusibacter sp. 3D3 TaxID=1048380 RepID=UPI001586D7F0|nr:PBECR2 nuclease fold domain-containing protein [Fusibacter sp. 3D3]